MNLPDILDLSQSYPPPRANDLLWLPYCLKSPTTTHVPAFDNTSIRSLRSVLLAVPVLPQHPRCNPFSSSWVSLPRPFTACHPRRSISCVAAPSGVRIADFALPVDTQGIFLSCLPPPLRISPIQSPSPFRASPCRNLAANRIRRKRRGTFPLLACLFPLPAVLTRPSLENTIEMPSVCFVSSPPARPGLTNGPITSASHLLTFLQVNDAKNTSPSLKLRSVRPTIYKAKNSSVFGERTWLWLRKMKIFVQRTALPPALQDRQRAQTTSRARRDIYLTAIHPPFLRLLLL